MIGLVSHLLARLNQIDRLRRRQLEEVGGRGVVLLTSGLRATRGQLGRVLGVECLWSVRIGFDKVLVPAAAALDADLCDQLAVLGVAARELLLASAHFLALGVRINGLAAESHAARVGGFLIVGLSAGGCVLHLGMLPLLW